MTPAGFDNAAWRKRHKMRRGHPVNYCRECRAVLATLTKHCVGRMLTDAEEAAIASGVLNFENGVWVGKHPTRNVETR